MFNMVIFFLQSPLCYGPRLYKDLYLEMPKHDTSDVLDATFQILCQHPPSRTA